MKLSRLALALTVINLMLLLILAARTGSTTVESVTPILRGRALELVDDRGQVRGQLDVESSGEVVFRLRDAKGTIRVKLGAGEDGSGLVLLDEATEPGIHMIARRTGTAERPTTTSITMRGADGHERVIRP